MCAEKLEFTKVVLKGERGERWYGEKARVDTTHHLPGPDDRVERQH